MMMVPHHVAQQMMLAQQGGGRGAGKGKSKKWTREGAEENAMGGEMDTSKTVSYTHLTLPTKA